MLSVVMANYKTPLPFLKEAVQSVLDQSFAEFEFIIVDDCSEDESLTYLRTLTDSRIVLIENEVNMGLTKSLNIALKQAKGKYLARMDSDDICEPERFAKQIAYLQQYPDTIVCGSWARYFGADNRVYQPVLPSREEYRIRLLFGNSPTIIHPSAMLNLELLKRHGITYDERFPNSQDYKLWIQCADVADCMILPEVLLKYRVHEKQISKKNNSTQNRCMLQIVREQLEDLDIYPNDEELQMHLNALRADSYCQETEAWLLGLLQKNKQKKKYSQPLLEKLIYGKLEALYLQDIQHGFTTIKNHMKNLPGKYKFRLLCRYTKRKFRGLA